MACGTARKETREEARKAGKKRCTGHGLFDYEVRYCECRVKVNGGVLEIR